jgi:hypothetical protein
MSPELLGSIDRFRQEMESVDDVAHVLLKGHLLLEEAISSVLDQYVFHREHLAQARLSFAQKALLARSFCLRKDKLGEWDLVAAINSLRNDLSHRLNSPDRARKLAVVKELYFREAAGFDRIDDVKKESDAVILFNACAHCAGFLATFEADSKSFRRMVHGFDRGMNSDLPAFEL